MADESKAGPLGPVAVALRTDPALAMSEAEYDAYAAAHYDPKLLKPHADARPTLFHLAPLPKAHVALDLDVHEDQPSRQLWYALAAACHKVTKPDGTVVEVPQRALGPDLHGARRAPDAWLVEHVWDPFGKGAVYALGAVAYSRAHLKDTDRLP